MPTAARSLSSGLFLIAGPCVLESRGHALKLAKRLGNICARLGAPLIFKASFDKANRSSLQSYRGPGLEAGLAVLKAVKEETGLPVLSDVHETCQVERAAEVLDVLQIPAFLCRQTDLIVAAARTGKPVNIKKGQFMAPDDMKLAAEKVVSAGNRRILLTERGTTFGYHNLVVDMRSLAIMRKTGFPVVLDATHSVQLPGGESTRSGGEPEFIFPIARAGVAVGCDALFVETHPDPPRALSDAASQLKLDLLEDLIKQVMAIDAVVKKTSKKRS